MLFLVSITNRYFSVNDSFADDKYFRKIVYQINKIKKKLMTEGREGFTKITRDTLNCSIKKKN